MTHGMPNTARRDANEPKIVQALERLGWVVLRLDVPTDLVIARGSAHAFVDVKNPEHSPSRRRLTKVQTAFAARWPGPVLVVETIDDVEAIARWDGDLAHYPHRLDARSWEPKSRKAKK